MITEADIYELVNASLIAGYKVNPRDLRLLTWISGIDTHVPQPLPFGFSAVYIFEYGGKYLKVGHAGKKSAPRYVSHHYYTTAPSTLAKSLLKDPSLGTLLNNQTPRNWIMANTTRYNILIPDTYNQHFVNFAEAFFILKCNPRFEG